MSMLEAGRYLGRPTTRIATSRGTVVESTYAAGTRLRAHAHARMHFCLVLEGGYEEQLGRHASLRQPGTVLFLPTGCEHAERHLTAGRHLMIEAGDQVLAEVRELARVPTAAVTMARRSATRLGARIARELRRPDTLTPIVVDALIAELLGEVCRESHRPDSRGDWVAAVRDLLEAEPLRAHDLAGLGRAVGRHPMHVARSFRRRFGLSVGGYLRQQRVLWAAAQLRETGASIAEVAAAAGFSDQSHLSRWCRAFLGQAPSELKQR
jgi:AraC family transcriptional regulator